MIGILAVFAPGAFGDLVFVAPRMIPMGAGAILQSICNGADCLLQAGFGGGHAAGAGSAALAHGPSGGGDTGHEGAVFLGLFPAIGAAGAGDLRWAALLPGLALTLARLLLIDGRDTQCWFRVWPALLTRHRFCADGIGEINGVCRSQFGLAQETSGNSCRPLDSLAGRGYWLGHVADVAGLRLWGERAGGGGARRRIAFCMALLDGRFGFGLAGDRFLQPGHPMAQFQSVRAAHRKQNVGFTAVFFCVVWPLANVDPDLCLRAVHAGNTCFHQGAPLSLAKIKNS